MNSFALASVFTPGILLYPDHALNPSHYKLSQKVVQFLIEHQHHFHLPHQHHTQQYVSSFSSSSNKIAPTHNHSSISSNKSKQQLLRANTVPAKQNRFGPNDPLQVINK